MNEKAAAMTRLEIYILTSVLCFFFVVVPSIYCSLRWHRKQAEALSEQEVATNTVSDSRASTHPSTGPSPGSAPERARRPPTRRSVESGTDVAPSVVSDVTVLESTTSPLPLPPNSTVISGTPALENFPSIVKPSASGEDVIPVVASADERF